MDPDMSPAKSVRIGLRVEPASAAPALPVVDPELVDGLARAEQLGFDTLWISERPTLEDALVPSALLCCAAIAARTERMHVATGLLPLPLHHPLRVAEDAATLDLVSGGRFELGLGLGSDPGGLEQWGVAREERVERFAEAVSLLRQAFSGKPTTFRGRYFNLDATLVAPAPHTEGGPPLWIGAVRPEGQELAARLGAGLVLPAGADATPYLEAAVEAGAGGQRVAWLLGAPEGAVSAASAALEAAPDIAVDLVVALPADALPGLEGLEPLADGLRQLCP